MEETQTQSVPAAASAPAAPDPFSLDETALISLTPEQRAGVEPIIESWKKRATEEISKRETAVRDGYKSVEEKAQALEKLTAYQPFVQWWQAQQNQGRSQATNSAQAQAINQTRPEDIATQQQWQEAIWEASNGDANKLQNLQQKLFSTWANPVIQQMSQRQKVLETQMAVKDLFERHPDAKELDTIGLDSKTRQGVSLLEQALDWSEKNNRSLEEGYQLARRWADSLNVSAQQKAMGMVNEKKQSVSGGNSTSSNSSTVVEVENMDELIQKDLQAQLSGNTNVRFVIKGKS